MHFERGKLSWENWRNKYPSPTPHPALKKLNETFEAPPVIMSQPLFRALNALADTQIDPTPIQRRLNLSAANGNQTNKSIDVKLTLMQQDLGPLEGPNVAGPALRQAERWWRGEGGGGGVRKQTQRFRWATKEPLYGSQPWPLPSLPALQRALCTSLARQNSNADPWSQRSTVCKQQPAKKRKKKEKRIPSELLQFSFNSDCSPCLLRSQCSTTHPSCMCVCGCSGWRAANPDTEWVRSGHPEGITNRWLLVPLIPYTVKQASLDTSHSSVSILSR